MDNFRRINEWEPKNLEEKHVIQRNIEIREELLQESYEKLKKFTHEADILLTKVEEKIHAREQSKIQTFRRSSSGFIYFPERLPIFRGRLRAESDSTGK